MAERDGCSERSREEKGGWRRGRGGRGEEGVRRQGESEDVWMLRGVGRRGGEWEWRGEREWERVGMEMM